MPVSYISHKGRNILHVDFKDIKDKRIVLENLDLMVAAYKESTEDIYLLLDVRGTFTDPEVMDKLKQNGKTTFKGKSKKRAVLGVTGIKAMLLKGYKLFTNTELSVFDTIEEAKEYLAS